jgi:hypothetical protein
MAAAATNTTMTTVLRTQLALGLVLQQQEGPQQGAGLSVAGTSGLIWSFMWIPPG